MGIFSWLTKKSHYIPEGAVTSLDRQQVQEIWAKIEDLVKLGKPSTLREAVLTADKLVDFILKKMYPSLSTMGERLKEVKPKFAGNYNLYDDLWFAHKVRNEMVHNLDFELPTIEAVNVLQKFKTALQHLGFLN